MMGGRFANTELRSLTDPRVFNYLDFITLDDGEAPLLNLIECLEGKRRKDELKRTFVLENGKVDNPGIIGAAKAVAFHHLPITAATGRAAPDLAAHAVIPPIPGAGIELALELDHVEDKDIRIGVGAPKAAGADGSPGAAVARAPDLPAVCVVGYTRV